MPVRVRELRRRERSGAGHGPVQTELVADHHHRAAEHRADVADGLPTNSIIFVSSIAVSFLIRLVRPRVRVVASCADSTPTLETTSGVRYVSAALSQTTVVGVSRDDDAELVHREEGRADDQRDRQRSLQVASCRDDRDSLPPRGPRCCLSVHNREGTERRLALPPYRYGTFHEIPSSAARRISSVFGLTPSLA